MARSDKKGLWFSWLMLLVVFLGAILTNDKLTWPVTLVPEVLDPIDEATLPSGRKILLIGTAINPKNDYGKIPADAKQGWNAQGIGANHPKGLSAYIKVPGKKNTAFDKIAYATIGLDDPDSPYDRDDLLFDRVGSSYSRDVAKSLLKKNILSLYFEVYPKSARSLTLRIYNEDSKELASFAIENPDSVRTQPQQWEPEPLPIHRDVDGATISLVDARVQPAQRKVYATQIERFYGVDAMSPKIPRIKRQFLNEPSATVEMRCESRDNGPEYWMPIHAETVDEQGTQNQYQMFYPLNSHVFRDHQTYQIPNHAFHPNAIAWRITADWVRKPTARFTPDEKALLEGLDFRESQVTEVTNIPTSIGKNQVALGFLAGPSRLIVANGEVVERSPAHSGEYSRIFLRNPIVPTSPMVVETGSATVGLRFKERISASQHLSAQLLVAGEVYQMMEEFAYDGHNWGLPEGEEIRVFALPKPIYDLNGDPIEFSDASLEVFLQDKVTAEFFVAFPTAAQ